MDIEDLEKICGGLSHSTKWMIYFILEEKERMHIVDLRDELRERYNFMQDYVRIKYHLRGMEEAGIVKIYIHKSPKKLDEVELLKTINLDVRDVPKQGQEEVEEKVEKKA